MGILRRLVVTNLIVLAALVVTAPGVVTAQCNWENWNCTPTPQPTPTGTLTPVPTGTLAPVVFEPLHFNVPTSIPPLTFPTAPPPMQFTPIPAPSAVSITINPITTPSYPTYTLTASNVISLSEINTTLNLSYTAPLAFDLGSISGSTTLSGSAVFTAANDVSGFIGDVVSFTNWLTGEAAALHGSEVITVIEAPSWYAPAMPRPLADIGWTYETLTNPAADAPKFTLDSWAGFFGYVASLPFQLIKTLWQLVAYFGPFGLFLAWLLIMFVIVALIHFQVFIVKFIFVAVRLVVRLVELIGAYLPTGG